jgi:hypothetical protein
MKTRKSYHQALLLLLTVISLILSACAGLPAPAAPAGGAAASGDENAAPAAEAPRAPVTSRDSSAAPAASGESSATYPTQTEPVTAGVTDDNEQWADYLDYLKRHTYVYANKRDVSERYVITVVDKATRTVHDATVEIYGGETLLFSGRTDAGGRVLFHPLALTSNRQQQRVREYRVVATKGFVARSETFPRNGAGQWTISLNEPVRLDYTQLDLLFLIDATGSMDDEIDKLKNTMADIADQIATLSERPDVRYGLVAYRDQGDAFVVRPYDFTPNLRDFQRNLAALRADGGGDEPEALNAALHASLNELHWRDEDTVRLIILVADAPPHLDYSWEGFSYDSDMIDAVRRGIKIFPVGASNLNGDGEYIFRQLAQFTGGKFVFLTYADGSDPNSGPGTETDHDVDNYSVDTLDRLVVRLVREELTKLSSVVNSEQGVTQSQQSQAQPSPIPTLAPPQLSCTINLQDNWHDCDEMTPGLLQLEQNYQQARLQLTLDLWLTGYDRARFDITYADEPQGWSVNIGDSRTNNGQGGDAGEEVNDAELQIFNGLLRIYGNDHTPAHETQDGNRLLHSFDDFVRQGETVAIEVAKERVGLNYGGGIEIVASPYLFALDGQTDRTGQVNQEIYAAFNRTIDGSSNGRGVSQVVVTLYPAR